MVWVHFRPPLKYTASTGSQQHKQKHISLQEWIDSEELLVYRRAWFGRWVQRSSRDWSGLSWSQSCDSKYPTQGSVWNCKGPCTKRPTGIKSSPQSFIFSCSAYVLFDSQQPWRLLVNLFLGLFVLRLSRQSACRLHWVNPANRCCH